MKAKIENKPVIILELSKDEFLWLKGVMQNPLHRESHEEEDSDNRKFRNVFWKQLAILNAEEF